MIVATRGHAACVVGLLGVGLLGLGLGGCGPSESSAAEGGGDKPNPAVTASSKAPSAASVAAPVPPPPPEAAPTLPEEDLYPKTITEQRAAMLRRMQVVLGLTPDQVAALSKILERNKVTGQGNPEVTEHPMTRAECREKRAAAGVVDPPFPRCGAANMVPIYDQANETADTAKVCIDRYEFPNLACDYPVTWVSAKNAHLMCRAIGKRLCDAHEWEGACAGSVLPVEAEYSFGRARKEQKSLHNQKREIRWAYGAEKDHAKCATNSAKTEACTTKGIGWKRCGSNTYPAGAFPECKSPFGVYDQHGNAAEHMNLPLKADQLASLSAGDPKGGKLGDTEMKGSWFIFSKYEAHVDDCRWRAPDWHGSRVMIEESHANYHLGFRCCRDVDPVPPAAADPAQ